MEKGEFKHRVMLSPKNQSYFLGIFGLSGIRRKNYQVDVDVSSLTEKLLTDSLTERMKLLLKKNIVSKN